jgi:hypothetical protein
MGIAGVLRPGHAFSSMPWFHAFLSIFPFMHFFAFTKQFLTFMHSRGFLVSKCTTKV